MSARDKQFDEERERYYSRSHFRERNTTRMKFKHRDDALRKAAELRAEGYKTAYVVQDGNGYRVRL